MKAFERLSGFQNEIKEDIYILERQKVEKWEGGSVTILTTYDVI
jgi:hypothetical protein